MKDGPKKKYKRKIGDRKKKQLREEFKKNKHYVMTRFLEQLMKKENNCSKNTLAKKTAKVTEKSFLGIICLCQRIKCEMMVRAKIKLQRILI